MPKSAPVDLTQTDLKILKELQKNASCTTEFMSDKVAKSRSVVSRRISELKRLKVITGIHAAIDADKVGLGVSVYKLVTLEGHGNGMTKSFEGLIDHMPNIVEWSRIMGSWDYLIKIVTHNAAEQDEVHAKLLALPMVKRLRGKPVIGKTHVKPLPFDISRSTSSKR